MRRELLLSEFMSTPWAMMPERLEAAANVLLRWRLSKGHSDEDLPRLETGPDDDQTRLAAAARRSSSSTVAGTGRSGGSIALIQVFGTIVQRAGMMTKYCGGTSTQDVRSMLASALRDETIGQVLMEFDTPGGSVADVQELGDDIFRARGQKPIIGLANSLCASAGYWLLSQCSEAYVTPGGQVGSIGVYTVHEDVSKALDAAGVKVTLIQAGKYKTEGHPYGPLDPDAKANTQASVDFYYGAFTRAVARGRGVGVDAVRNGMGQGRVLNAGQAQAERMVDGIATLDQLVGSMVSGKSLAGKRGGSVALLPAPNHRARNQRRLQLLNMEIDDIESAQISDALEAGDRDEAQRLMAERNVRRSRDSAADCYMAADCDPGAI